MAKALMYVEGADGQLELLPDRVIVHRKGLWCAMRYGFNARREIPLGAISEVSFRPASIQFGEIEFVRSGRSNEQNKKNAGIVRFNRKKNAEMERFKEKVFELMNQMQRQKS